MAIAASARPFITEASRSSSRADRTSTAMMVARITEGSGPTTAANPSTVTMAPSAAARRGAWASVSSAHTVDAMSATLKPETASTW